MRCLVLSRYLRLSAALGCLLIDCQWQLQLLSCNNPALQTAHSTHLGTGEVGARYFVSRSMPS